MDRRGQVYILAAVIISVILFALALSINKVSQSKLDDDFIVLSENYNSESSHFLNALIKKPSDVPEEFGEFSYSFSSYARSQSPQFELLYVFKQGDTLYIGNFLENTIEVYNANVESPAPLETIPGCFDKIDVKLGLGGLGFTGEAHSDVSACIKQANLPATTPAQKLAVCIVNPGEKTCYKFSAISGKPQMMIVAGQSEGDQRQVFVGGEGFLKEESDIGDLNEE